MGFCFGVRRAVEMMEEAVGERGAMVSLGSVVHNPQVVERLQERGLEVIADLRGVGGRPVAITAHGVGPEVVAALEGKGVEIVDTTCPIVTRSQQWAKRLSEEGFAIVLFGDARHKEVRGVAGWATGKLLVVASEEELRPLPEDFPSRVAVLAQTTETEAHFASFVKRLLETNIDRISELRVVNTLCHATTAQQGAAVELADEVEMVVVVGGRDSANTRHLAEVARERGVPTYHVESAEDIDPTWLAGRERVGVTAGASTPDYAIDAVVARIEAIGESLRAAAPA
jgi:4-hydroxy-3-methylbut-2-enyl diphosphate reductase